MSFRQDCIQQIEVARKTFGAGDSNSERKRIYFILDNDLNPNEGEIKCLKFLKERTSQDSIIVSTDNDVIVSSFLLIDKSISILTVFRNYTDTIDKIVFNNQTIMKLLFKGDTLLVQWFGLLLFATFGGDYLPPFLKSHSLNQMEAVYGLVCDDKVDLHNSVTTLDDIFTDYNVLKKVISLILRSLKNLTSRRRVLHKNIEQNTKCDIGNIELFLSDLLWVYGHYSCNNHIVPNRDNFLAQTKIGYHSFTGIANSVFQDEFLINKLNIESILSNATCSTCSIDPTWENTDNFRQALFV
jgi:hypothetical protein